MRKIRFITIILSTVAMFILSCSSQPASSEGSTIATRASYHVVPKPMKIALLQDETPSTTWTGTPTLISTDIDPIIDLLCHTGGEIGFGLIIDNSNKSLIRLRIELPPVQPIVPSKNGNPYKVADKFSAYDGDMQDYRNKFALWRQHTDEEIKIFKVSVDKLLKRERHAKCTDVWSALRHTDLFLSEEDTWGKETNKFVLLISDGQDNVHRGKVMSMNGRLIIVNAAGSIGSLTELHPLRFESIASAVRFIATDKEEK